MNYTPGPWQTSGIRIKIDGQPFLQVDAPNGPGIVAYIPYSDRTPSDHVQSHADQRLIAAAPDLLEALRLYDRTYASTQNHPTVVEEAKVIEVVRAAIAKATGQ